LEAIAPQEPYSKMLVRERAKRRGPRKQVGKTPPLKKSLAKSTSLQSNRKKIAATA